MLIMEKKQVTALFGFSMYCLACENRMFRLFCLNCVTQPAIQLLSIFTRLGMIRIAALVFFLSGLIERAAGVNAHDAVFELFVAGCA
jgi:uncharacterized membrane protein